jgi:hypothetical protein
MHETNELCPIDPITGVVGEPLNYHIGADEVVPVP